MNIGSTVLVAFLTILSPAVAYRKRPCESHCWARKPFTVTIYKQYAEILIPGAQFGQQRLEWFGNPSCRVFLCPTASFNEDCIMEPFMVGLVCNGCMLNINLTKELSGRIYVKAECYTLGMIKSGETIWLPIFIPAEFVAPIGETRQKPLVQDAVINMKVTAVVRMQLIWDIEMRNGDPFIPSVRKSITIKRHHQIDADHYDDGIVISNDINKHVIDDGLSPGYNFRWTCYLYSIDVTFQNDRHAYKEVERCFSLFSPSFVFLFGAMAISIVLCIQFKAVTTEDTEHTQRALRRFRRLRI
uniref:CX domain-containing protein n=1 Tax=Haemonchus contortus TaxID=6289 RepID=A0A7I4Z8S9_HAECO